VVDELSFDRFHTNADRIYQVGLHGKIGGQDVMVANTCPPMAETLVKEVPGVKEATRIANFWGAPTLKYGDKAFTEERVFHADSNFFSFFSYKLLQGDPKTALLEPNTLVLTEHIAKKYFGSENPLGKLIAVGGNNTYKITGVAEDAPLNSHFVFNVLLSSRSVEQLERHEWLNNFLYTYFKLDDHASVGSVEGKFKDLVVKYVGPEVEKFMGVSIKQMEAQGGAYGYFTTALTDIHLRPKTRDGLEPAGNIMYVYFFAGIGIFIILIACINFMNLSTARSAGRAKEVGLRKTLGSLRGQMIRQFLAESIVYSLIAVVVALVICYLILPQFNLLAGKQLALDIFMRPVFVCAILFLVLLVGVVAGSYPAFYLTSFSAVEVLKGKIRAGMKTKGVRSTLVVFQFALSIFLIIFTAVVYQQITYMQQRDLGIDKHNVLVLPNAGFLDKNKVAFKNELLEQTGIVSASYTNNNFPGVNNTTVFKAAGSEQDHIMGVYYADYDHQYVIRFQMKEGRYFSNDFPSDSTAIILNEAAVKEFGFVNPLENEILWNFEDKLVKLRIIGVFKDFNFESLKTKIRPLAIRLTNDSYSLMMRYDGKPAEVVSTVEKIWKKYVPGQPFDYNFLDQNFDNMFRSEQRMGHLFTVFSGLAIFIACLGLFALAAFMAEQRTKEIGIRKAMGATTTGLTLMLSKEFTKLVIIAFIPAAVVAWFVVESWLNDFAYRIDVNPMIFVLSGVIATAISWVTVSFQSIRAAGANPVNSLRYE
jgi:putative ABC transport system permease protein